MKKILLDKKHIPLLLVITMIILINSCTTHKGVKYFDNLGNEISLDTNQTVIIRIPDELRNLSYFPTGTFLAGEDRFSIQRGSAPAIYVSLSHFLMEKTEVSNLEYFSFMDSLKSASRSTESANRLIKELIEDRGRVENDIEIFFAKIEKLQFSYNYPEELFPKLDSLRLFKNELKFNYLDPVLTLKLTLEYIKYDPEIWGNDLVMKDNYHTMDNYPIVGIPWIGAKLYAAYHKKRLPTEMEFEYAMRNGEDHDKTFFFTWLYDGDPPLRDQNSRIFMQKDFKNYYFANYIYSFGIAAKDSFNYSAPVKSFPQGTKGLYNIAGNVSEFCEDDYEYNSYQKKNVIEEVINPVNISIYRNHSNLKVVKGGSWKDYIYKLRSNFRDAALGSKKYAHIGFRCVMDVDIFMDKIIKDIKEKIKSDDDEVVIFSPRDLNYTQVLTETIKKYLYDRRKQKEKDILNDTEDNNLPEESKAAEESSENKNNGEIKIRE